MTKDQRDLPLPPGPGFPEILHYWKLLIRGDVDAVAPALLEAYGPVVRVDITLNRVARMLLDPWVQAEPRSHILMVGPEANRLSVTKNCWSQQLRLPA